MELLTFISDELRQKKDRNSEIKNEIVRSVQSHFGMQACILACGVHEKLSTQYELQFVYRSWFGPRRPELVSRQAPALPRNAYSRAREPVRIWLARPRHSRGARVRSTRMMQAFGHPLHCMCRAEILAQPDQRVELCAVLVCGFVTLGYLNVSWYSTWQ